MEANFIPYQKPKGFVSVIDQERKILGDFTLPDGTYVSLQRNLLDLLQASGLLTPAVKDIDYNSTTNTLIVTYTDSTPPKELILNGSSGKTLTSVTLDPVTQIITFGFSDGSNITLDLSTMMTNYYTKTEVDNMFENITSIVWNEFP